MTLFEITEGWTEPLDAQLAIAGAAFDASGMVVTVVIRDRDGTVVAVPVAWLTQVSSSVRLSPSGVDLVAARGPFTIRYKVVDAAGKVTFVPPADPAQIVVHSA